MGKHMGGGKSTWGRGVDGSIAATCAVARTAVCGGRIAVGSGSTEGVRIGTMKPCQQGKEHMGL